VEQQDKIPEWVRHRLYNIATAVIPLLIVLGVITDDVAALILSIAAAVLGLSVPQLAACHTKSKKELANG
jgi:hypothetical protein